MKRNHWFLILAALLCLTLALAGCGQKEEQVDVTWDGVLVTGDGAEACQVRVKGTSVTERPDGETPYFTTGEDGGVWAGETKIDIPDVGFFTEKRDYTLMEDTGTGCVYVLGHEIDLLVICGSGETGPFVLLASEGEDDRIPEVLERLSEEADYARLIALLEAYLEN